MKVRLKKDFYEWKAGVEYPAEPFFEKNICKEGVLIGLPGLGIKLFVGWEDIDTAE